MPCTRTGIPLRSIPAGDGHVMVRHDVAQFECTQAVIWSTRYVPAGPYAGVLPSR